MPLGVDQRLLHLGRIGDRDADSAEGLGHACVVARHLGDAELRPRRRVSTRIRGHASVVQDHRGDRSARALRGLGIQTRHSKRAVAHEVQAELVRACQLGADHQRNAKPEVGGLPPTDIPVRGSGLVERNDRVARCASVVGDNRPGLVQRGVDLVDDPIGVDRDLVGLEQRCPLLHPLLPLGRDPVAYAGVSGSLADGRLDLVYDHLEGRLGIARQPNVDALLLVYILDVVGVLDEHLTRWDRLSISRVSQAGAYGEDHVRFQQPLASRPGCCARPGSERQRVRLRERALALHGRVHGYVEQLSEVLELLGRVTEQYASTGPEHRIVGFQKQLGRVLHVRPRRRHHRAAWRPVVLDHPVWDIGPHHVCRHLHCDRSTGPIAERVEGATHRIADLSWRQYHFRLL